MNKRAQTCQARATTSQIQRITFFLFTAGCLVTGEGLVTVAVHHWIWRPRYVIRIRGT